jgi:hypothetical protein
MYRLVRGKYMRNIILLCTIIIFTISAKSNDINILSSVENNKVTIHWSLTTPNTIKKTSILLNNKEINSSNKYAPNSTIKTSIYFLIDTSIPMKEAFNKGIKPLLKNIIPRLDSSRHSYAIAGFDKNLNIIKNFLDNNSQYKEALNTLKIQGYRTELYRLTLEAIKQLNKQNSERKILILISDGDFEDTTYSVNDVILKANKNRIQILSLAYRDLVKMQGIQKPAIDTAGKMWIANKQTHQMPQKFMDELLPYFDNGGIISFSKENFASTDNGLQNLTLNIETESDTLEKEFTTTVKKIKTVKNKQIIKEKENNTLLYILSALALLISLLSLFFKKKKDPIPEKSIPEAEEEILRKPIAYLILQSGEKYPILNNMTSIGRNNDNDIVIEGTYISTYHADIIYKYDEFLISDKNSTNGIGINSPAIKEGKEKITQGKLNDGDIIYLGPLELLFKKEETTND